MGYLSFSEAGFGGTGEVTVAPTRSAFSSLEWSVVALARQDRLSTLRTPGRFHAALATLFGGRRDPRLADPRLEALRRIAVLSWHYGYTVPSHAVRDFIAAGYTAGQYELLVDATQARRG